MTWLHDAALEIISDMNVGAKLEREAIVKWLRHGRPGLGTGCRGEIKKCADEIEAGEHLKEEAVSELSEAIGFGHKLVDELDRLRGELDACKVELAGVLGDRQGDLGAWRAMYREAETKRAAVFTEAALERAHCEQHRADLEHLRALLAEARNVAELVGCVSSADSWRRAKRLIERIDALEGGG